MKTGAIRAFAILMLMCAAVAVHPVTASPAVRRDLLALYDGAHDQGPDQTSIHNYLEMPLNHLGYRLVYHNIRAGLPDVSSGPPYHGTVIWLPAKARPLPGLHEWMAALERQGLRVILIANSASLPTTAHGEPTRSFELLTGLEYRGYFVELTHTAKRVALSKGLATFEGRADVPLPPFPAVELKDRAAELHIAIEHDAGRQRRTSVVAASGSFGGYIAEEYAIAFDGTTRRMRWLIDPFQFLFLALGRVDPWPIPDVTTIAGRRVYFSHVDGDGWGNVTSVPGYAEREAISAEVLLKELVEPFPDLPITIGIIAGDIDPALGGSAQSRKTALELLAQRQVEAGCHTYTHPYDWRLFGDYSRAAELQRIATTRASLPKESTHGAEKERKPPPRLYSQYPYDANHEVAGAIAAIEQLLPAGKRVKLYQWSGSTSPDENIVRLTRLANVGNINGGDSRLDRQFPSHAYVRPLARSIGRERQIYAATSNEYIYWGTTGSRASFRLLTETLDATEAPRRLKPYNLYYHVYSADQLQTLAIVRQHIQAARRSDLVPVPASHYAAMVDGFFSVEITPQDAGQWILRGRGALETVRFDAANGFELDLVRSRGVLGGRRNGDVLYVALDPSIAEPLVAIAPTAAGRGGGIQLVESRWRISHLTLDDCAVRFNARGYGTGEMVWSGLPLGNYLISARSAGATWQEARSVGTDSRLTFSIQLDAIDSAAVQIRCVP